MSKTHRDWTLLEKIPGYPRMRLVSDLKKDLEGEGYPPVDVRTIQRNLQSLAEYFAIDFIKDGQAYLWFWLEGTKTKTFPSMPPTTALVMQLADAHLGRLLPPKARKAMQPYFRNAEEILGSNMLRKWQERVRVLPDGMDLPVPDIDEDIFNRVTSAMLDGDQIAGRYRRPNGELKFYKALNPLGLVVKRDVMYLVATASSHFKPKFHFALHRFTSVESTERPAVIPPNFDIDEHIREQHDFNWLVSEKVLGLELLITEDLKNKLQERPINSDQVISETRTDQLRLKARVEDTHELRWWLLAHGENVEVIKPKSLRKEFSKLAGKLHKLYGEQ